MILIFFTESFILIFLYFKESKIFDSASVKTRYNKFHLFSVNIKIVIDLYINSEDLNIKLILASKFLNSLLHMVIAHFHMVL